MSLVKTPSPRLFAPASRGHTGFSKRGAGGYGVHPCCICGVSISTNGAGTAAHLKAHVKRGEARVSFNDLGEPEYEPVWTSVSP